MVRRLDMILEALFVVVFELLIRPAFSLIRANSEIGLFDTSWFEFEELNSDLANRTWLVISSRRGIQKILDIFLPRAELDQLLRAFSVS
jgi:hypothetical protein